MAVRIRGLDWSSTPLGASDVWPQSLRTVVDLLLPSGFGMVALWGPELIQIYNDAYRGLMGIKHPAGLGQPTRDCWPEVWHINAPIYARVHQGETVSFEDALYPVTRSGQLDDAWFTLTYGPLRDETGAVGGVLVTVFEVTARVRAERQHIAAEAEMRNSEARYRAFVTASADVVYRMSPDWSEMRQLDGRGFLADTGGPARDWADTYILPEDRAAVFAAIGRAIRDRTTFELEHRVRRADGGIGWTLSRAVPILNADGSIAEWFGTASNVTARRAAEEKLRESEALLRIALTGGGMGMSRWDLQRRLVWGDPKFLDLWGFPPSDDPHALALFTGRMSSKGAADMEVIVSKAIEMGEDFDGPLEIVSGPTAGRWIRWRGRAKDEGMLILYGVTFDITAEKQAADRMQVLVGELQHRTRNLMGVVRSIMDATLRSSGDLDTFAGKYRDRIGALARVQGLLSRLSSGDRVQFDDLIRDELHAMGALDRVTLRGPGGVALRSSTVQTFAMALHELATNAAKYGALAQPDGRLAVTWRVVTEEPDGRPWLHVDWHESGVSMPPTGPGRGGSGQGRLLIERALPYQLGARTAYVMGPDGVRCSIAVPVSFRTLAEEARDERSTPP